MISVLGNSAVMNIYEIVLYQREEVLKFIWV